ncbi:MAG: hypothetical protein U0324_21160 [Polyangiales bacterium]
MADLLPNKKKRAPAEGDGELDPNELRQLITDPVERRDHAELPQGDGPPAPSPPRR